MPKSPYEPRKSGARGLSTTAELARAVELLKTRDRNRQKELRAVRAEVESIRSSLPTLVIGPSSPWVGQGSGAVPLVIPQPKAVRNDRRPQGERSLLDRFLDKWVRG